MDTGVVYLLTNMQLAARLVVSIHSLRKWYDGPVTVFTTRPESHRIGGLMAADSRLRIEHRVTNEVTADNPYTSAYLTKVAFLDQSPHDATVFIDADTLVVGAIDELLEHARSAPLTVTTYGCWATTDPPLNKSWSAWRSAVEESATPDRWRPLIDHTVQHSSPLINTGVFTIQRNATIMSEWRELTDIGRLTATPEESALQLLLPRHPYQLLGCQYNCLPYLHAEMPDVRIWHFAGASHLSSPVCRSIWLPTYRECTMLDVARISTWSRIEKTNSDCTE